MPIRRKGYWEKYYDIRYLKSGSSPGLRISFPCPTEVQLFSAVDMGGQLRDIGAGGREKRSEKCEGRIRK